MRASFGHGSDRGMFFLLWHRLGIARSARCDVTIISRENTKIGQSESGRE